VAAVGDRREPPRREYPQWMESSTGTPRDAADDDAANGENGSANSRPANTTGNGVSDIETLRSLPRRRSSVWPPQEQWSTPPDGRQTPSQDEPQGYGRSAPRSQPQWQEGYAARGAPPDRQGVPAPQSSAPRPPAARQFPAPPAQPAPPSQSNGQTNGRGPSRVSDIETLIAPPTRQKYIPQLPSSPLHPAYPVAPELDPAPLDDPVTRKVPAPRFPANAIRTPVGARKLTEPPAHPYWDDDEDDVAEQATVRIPIITSAMKSVRKIEKSAHLLRGTIVQTAGRILKIGAGVVAISLASRGLGINYFGDYVVVFAFVMLFNAVATFGVDRILVRDLAQAEEHTGAHDHFVRVSMTTKLLMSFLAMALAIVFAFLVQFPSRIILEIALFTPYILVTAFCSNGLFGSVLQANFQSGRIAAASVLAALVTLAGTAFAWVIHGGVNLFLFAYVLAGVVDLAICYTGARKYATLRPAWSTAAAKYVMKESWPLGVASGFVMVYGRIDTVMLEKLTNNQEVALYGVAYKFFDVLSTVAATVMIVLFPAMARAFTQGRKIMSDLYSRMFSLMLAMGLALTFLVVQFRQLAIIVVVSHRYLAAQTAIPGLMLAIAIIFPSSVVSYMLVVTRHQNWQISLALLASVVNIGLNFWLMPHFGYVAAAWVTAATEGFVMLYDITLIAVLAKFFPDLRQVALVLLAGTPLGVMLFAPTLTDRVPALAHLPFAGYIEGALALIIYAVLLMVFGIIRPSLVGELFGRKPRRAAKPQAAPAPASAGVVGAPGAGQGYAARGAAPGIPTVSGASVGGWGTARGAQQQREPSLASARAREHDTSFEDDDPDEYQIWLTDEAPTLVLGAVRLGPRSSQTGSFAAIKKPPQWPQQSQQK